MEELKMQKKCHRCGNFFTPTDGAIYCNKCSGTELSDSEPAETVDKYSGFCFNESDVKEIILYESLLKPTGAEYIKHFTVSLH